jgi:hypothetical protein
MNDGNVNNHDGESNSRGELPREFHFFPYFPITAFFFAVISLGLVFVLWLPILYLYFYAGILNGQAVRASSYCTATFLLVVLFGRLSQRELGKVRFIVSPEGVARRAPFRTIGLRWEDIEQVRCRRLPFVKGFVEISGGRRKLLLPSTIAEFALLGQEIARGLERAGKGNRCNDATLQRIGAMALVAEGRNERARRSFLPFTAATIGTVLFNALIAARVWAAGPIPIIFWASCVLPLPLLAYSIADARLNRRHGIALVNGDDFDARSAFRSELLFSALITTLAYGVLGIVIKPIFLP